MARARSRRLPSGGFGWLFGTCVAISVLSCRGGCGRGDSDLQKPSPGKGGAAPEEKVFGSYGVPGLAESELRPLVVFQESDAWSGSPEGLPSVVIYERGLVLRAERGQNSVADLQAGTLDRPLDLARHLEELGLAKLERRIRVSEATDQPEVTVSYRIGSAWRSTTVVGLHRDGDIPAKRADPPEEFMEAYRGLRKLALTDVHPFVRTAYVVHLWDAEMSPGAPLPWPAAVPPPPKTLVPDERFLGRPRSYSLSGEPGLALYRFVREVDGGRPPMRTPSGDTVAVWVTSQIPDQGYIAHVGVCSYGEKEAYQECVKVPQPL
jgi:hypothetical protein